MRDFRVLFRKNGSFLFFYSLKREEDGTHVYSKFKMQAHNRVLIYMILFHWEALIILFTPRPLDNYVILLHTGHSICISSFFKKDITTLEELISLFYPACHRLELQFTCLLCCLFPEKRFPSIFQTMFIIHGSVISGVPDIQGCGHRILPGGVGMPGPHPEGLVPGCDGGELQDPALPG